MSLWTADFANNPFDDYNLMVEIHCDGEEVGVIKRGQNGLEIKWYPNKNELAIPLDWLLGLLFEATKRMSSG